jgi:hypothetical protein
MSMNKEGVRTVNCFLTVNGVYLLMIKRQKWQRGCRAGSASGPAGRLEKTYRKFSHVGIGGLCSEYESQVGHVVDYCSGSCLGHALVLAGFVGAANVERSG